MPRTTNTRRVKKTGPLNQNMSVQKVFETGFIVIPDNTKEFLSNSQLFPQIVWELMFEDML